MSLYDGKPIVGGDIAGMGQVVPGHEPAGEIAALGPGVTSRRVGDRVAISLAIGCGHCRWCLRGYRFLCPTWKCIGFDVDGGDAEYLVVPEVNAMPIPDSMSFDVAAVSTDMVGTQYSTQKRLDISGADTVAVFGIGPMGAAGILVAKARGARVIAVDVLDSRLAMARELGADETVDSRSVDTVARLRELTHGAGVDAAVECSGSPVAQNADDPQAAAGHGRLVLCTLGVPGGVAVHRGPRAAGREADHAPLRDRRRRRGLPGIQRAGD
jgi:threonine dehydrogenase-like Zn-dependent dehydrogenase